MKLYGISCNENQWKITGSRENGFLIVNKETYKGYNIKGDVIGINQIGENTFLVYRRTMRSEWAIDRYRLEDGESILEYGKRFQKCNFITEDKLIFDWESSVFAKVYSISENKELDVIGHIIDPNRSDASFCRGREIRFVMKNDDDEYPEYLEVVYTFGGLWCRESIQMLVDPETLQVVSQVYSTIRQKFIDLNEQYTLADLADEDSYYTQTANAYLQEMYTTDNTKDVGEMLEHLKIKKFPKV